MRGKKGAIERLRTDPPAGSVIVEIDEMGPVAAKSYPGRQLVCAASQAQDGGVPWLAMPFLGLSTLAATVPPGPLWQDEPAGYDVSEYHLQVPREWYQAGRITPLQHNVFSYMPMNVEVHDLLARHRRGKG